MTLYLQFITVINKPRCCQSNLKFVNLFAILNIKYQSVILLLDTITCHKLTC